jgi:hypothetical protein
LFGALLPRARATSSPAFAVLRGGETMDLPSGFETTSGPGPECQGSFGNGCGAPPL